MKLPFELESISITLALLLLLVACALPTLDLPGASNDSIVVFDITQSMNVEDQVVDGASVDRLTYARSAARAALRDLPCGSRVGWAVFAEYRTLLLLAPIEVCAHYNDLLATLDAIDGRMRWGNASEISKGAFWALRMAQEIGTRPNIVIVSDGHEAPPLRGAGPAMFDDLERGLIHGWVIGVGGDIPKPIPRTDADGKRLGFWRPEEVVQTGDDPTRSGGEHLSSLREVHLRALAQQIGFDYARLTGAGTLRAALRDPRFTQRRPVPTDVGWVPAVAALAVLAWTFRPTMRRRRQRAGLGANGISRGGSR